jgi:glycylpeptide N-tetradecanoyltransferase
MSGFSEKDVTEKMSQVSLSADSSSKKGSTSSAVATTTTTTDTSKMNVAQLAHFVQFEQYKQQKADYDRKQEKMRIKKEGKDVHKFWDTQPMPKKGDTVDNLVNEPMDPNTDISKVRQEPYGMPSGFEWCVIDVNDEGELEELYQLLANNYVEDDDRMFRFDYSKDFLNWALKPPGYLKDWHVGVRGPAKDGKPGKLLASITAVPATVQVHGISKPMVEINFLCIHKKLREKRLSPMLIREITRRVNLTNRWQAVYTAGQMLPGCKSSCRYWHRTISVEKLIDIRFSYLPIGKKMVDHVASLALPSEPKHKWRPMVEADIPEVTRNLNEYLNTLKLAQIFDEDEVKHLMLPKPNVMSSFVLESSEGANKVENSTITGRITDFGSFYHLKSAVLQHAKYKDLLAVYAYYSVANSMLYEDLMKDMLVLAKNEGADVFNCLDLMQNKDVVKNLNFGVGDGLLQYYVYNWKCAMLEPNEVGLVLV